MTIHQGIAGLVGQAPLLRLRRFSEQFQLNVDLKSGALLRQQHSEPSLT